VLRPDLSASQARFQQEEAAAAVERARAALARIDAGELSEEQDRGRLDLARDLLAQALEAHARGDHPQAAELANKAAVMAEDLADR
jgi:hypothetical protein